MMLMQDIRLIFRGAHYKKISTGEVIYDELQEVLQYVRVERTEGIVLQLYPKKATNGYCKKAKKLLLVECDGSLYNGTPSPILSFLLSHGNRLFWMLSDIDILLGGKENGKKAKCHLPSHA